jgi:aspartate racemase
MILLTAFYVLLLRRTSQEDIVIGTPVIGRQRIETEKLIGLFLNHLPLRVDLSGDPTFRDLLARVRQTVMEGYANQELPFGTLVERLLSKADPSRNPLFQVMFFFLTPPPVQKFAGLTAHPYEAYGGTARYDLLLSLWDRPEAISGFIEYNTALYDETAIEEFIEEFKALVSTMSNNIERRISGLDRH